MTLIELSVVILVLLVLIGMTFIGVQAWKRSADRAACIMNLRAAQQAVRAYSNMNKLSPGDGTSEFVPPIELPKELFGSGRFLERVPYCPGGGTYTFNGDEIPLVGSFYMSCSLADSDRHEPASHSEW